MNEALVAHRFQRLRSLHAASELSLDEARDVASEATGTLLTLHGSNTRSLEGAVRFRLKIFGRYPMFRAFDPEVVVCADDALYVFLTPVRGRSWPTDLQDSPPADALRLARELERALDELKRSDAPDAQLELADLVRDERGPYFLPASYAVPTAALATAPPELDLADRPLMARRIRRLERELAEVCRGYLESRDEGDADLRDLDDLARRWSGDEDTTSTRVVEPALDAALNDLDETGGGVLLEGRPRVDPSDLREIAEWARQRGRRLFALRPHLRPAAELPAAAESERGAVVVLEDFARYPAFAEGLTQLAQRGWLDGSEIVVVGRSSTDMDEAARLYVSSLRSRGSERFCTIEAKEGEGAAPSSPVSGIGGRVLEALEIAQRPLSEKLLERAFALSTQQFIDMALALRDQGFIEVLYGRSDVSPWPQLVVASRVRGPRLAAEERRREIQVLLASTLEALGERGNLGKAWLSVEAAAASDPSKLPGLVRKLVTRAKRQGAPLLEYAAYEILMAHAASARPRLEDRCNAAIRMGELHQQQGDLERADRIFAEALSFLESSRGQAVGRVAPLVANLALKMSELAQHRGEYKEASELVGDTIERYKDQLPAIQRGRLYLDLAWALLRLGRAREAARHCEMTLNILDAERYPHEVALAYNRLGITYLEASNYTQSLINLQRSLVLREQVEDTIGVARVHNNLSVVYRSMGRLAEAERSLRRSLELKSRLGDSLGVAATQLNLGLLAVEQSNFAEARRYATECLHVARPFQHRSMEAEAYGLLGEAAMGEGRHEEARELLLKDLEICRAIKHETERLATLRRLVSVLIAQDDLDEAARHLEDAREMLTSVKSRFEAAMLDSLEARLLERTGALAPAVDMYGSAGRVFGQLHRFDLQLDALIEKGRLEVRLGRGALGRRTLTEARELVARHELHRIPDSYHELESLGDGELESATSPAGAERCLDALASLLEEDGGLEPSKLERALEAVAEALSSEEVHWLRQPTQRSLSLVRGVFSTGAPSSDLELMAAATSDTTPNLVTDEPWTMVRTPGDPQGWLGVAREKPLQAAEIAFARAAAGLLVLLTSQQTLPAEPAADFEPDESPRRRHGMVGRSAALREVLRMVDVVKDNDVTILLLGENGTGKDLVAQAIHRAGGRHPKPFIAVNCAAVPPNLLESELFGHEKGAFTSAHEQRIGVFERAHGGTIFLDEIGEMPLAMQAKLLRVLQDKSFTRVGGTRTIRADVRVIAATNRDLMQEVDHGRFRMDLYYRLNVISILLPPLRERVEDIAVLVQHFLAKFSGEFRSPVRSISREATARLMEYPWPGNVRELENVIKNAMVFAEHTTLRVEDLPAGVLRGGGEQRRQSVEEAVQAMIEAEDYSEDRPLMPRVELLVAHGVVRSVGNKARAARLLGITKPTLYNRLRRFEALYGDDEGSETP